LTDNNFKAQLKLNKDILYKSATPMKLKKGLALVKKIKNKN